MVLLVSVAAGLAVVLALPRRPLLGVVARAGGSDAVAAEPPRGGWLQRHRLLCSLLAGGGCVSILGGTLGVVAAPGAAAAVWVAVGRLEPAEVRRAREQVLRDLPHVVGLLASVLRAGASPADAVDAVRQALPGPATDRLAAAGAQLALGIDPAEVWQSLAAEPGLAPLGRAMARATVSGTPVSRAAQRLADDLAQAARAAVEDRARTVGVKAALPLGLCLLPAFLLVGIVPLVAGLVSGLAG